MLWKMLNHLCIMLKNGHTFKNLRFSHRKIFKVCLVIFQDFACKGYECYVQCYENLKEALKIFSNQVFTYFGICYLSTVI